MLVFSTQLCELLPLLPFSLVQLSPPSPPFLFESVYTVLYTCKQGVTWRGGGYGVLGLRQINTCRKVPLLVNLDGDILHCLLWVLSFCGGHDVVLRGSFSANPPFGPALCQSVRLSIGLRVFFVNRPSCLPSQSSSVCFSPAVCEPAVLSA